MIWYIQTKKPYPPTTPTANTGQISTASTTKAMISSRRVRASAGVSDVRSLAIDALGLEISRTTAETVRRFPGQARPRCSQLRASRNPKLAGGTPTAQPPLPGIADKVGHMRAVAARCDTHPAVHRAAAARRTAVKRHAPVARVRPLPDVSGHVGEPVLVNADSLYLGNRNLAIRT